MNINPLLNMPYVNEVTLTGQNPPLRPPTLTASNLKALYSTDPIFAVIKDLNIFSTALKVQEASSILGVGFALSK